MRKLVFGMENLILEQKGISQIMWMLAISAETGVAITDFKEGIFLLYRLASDNCDKMEQMWRKMMTEVTENSV